MDMFHWDPIVDLKLVKVKIWSFLFSELEQVEQQKKDKEAAAQIASQAPTPTYTPDYAAGLGTPAATVSIWTACKYFLFID